MGTPPWSLPLPVLGPFGPIAAFQGPAAGFRSGRDLKPHQGPRGWRLFTTCHFVAFSTVWFCHSFNPQGASTRTWTLDQPEVPGLAGIRAACRARLNSCRCRERAGETRRPDPRPARRAALAVAISEFQEPRTGQAPVCKLPHNQRQTQADTCKHSHITRRTSSSLSS